MINNKYENVVVFSPDLDEAGIDAQIEKINGIVQAHGGTILKNDKWGRRELAYKIAKKNHGFYVVLVIDGDNSMVADLERQYHINESVLRYLIVLKDKDAPDFSRTLLEENAKRLQSLVDDNDLGMLEAL